MYRVYTAENLMLVEHMRTLLQQEGIRAVVRNEYLSSGLGELPACECWPELWVASEYLARRALLAIQSIQQQREVA